jgi:hypothetical protein
MINEIYKEAIQKLSSNARPQIKLSEEKLLLLVEEFNQAIKDTTEINLKEEILKKYLFILSHSTQTSKSTHESLLKSFTLIKEWKLNSDYFVFFLSAIQKQFIDHQTKSGDRIPFELFDKLKELLENNNPEIIEWTLRTIEALGPQSLLFQKEILKLKPSLLKLFNEHQKNTFMLVDLIKDNWKRFKK